MDGQSETTLPTTIDSSKQQKTKTKSSPPGIISTTAKELGVDYLISKEGLPTLKERHAQRLAQEQHTQQENLEKIFKLTFDSSQPDKIKNIDPDWLSHFMTIASNIRNNAMQHLWSRILKQEFTSPGAVSLKTLDTLRSMTHREAQVFHRACTLACHFGNDRSKKLLTALKAKHPLLPRLLAPKIHKINLGHFSLPYSDMLLLLELGLILKSELESGELAAGFVLPFSYQNHTYQITPNQKGLSFTYYRLSPTGQEIAELLGSKVHEPFRETILELLASYFIVEGE